jgi:hypothetical protein
VFVHARPPCHARAERSGHGASVAGRRTDRDLGVGVREGSDREPHRRGEPGKLAAGPCCADESGCHRRTETTARVDGALPLDRYDGGSVRDEQIVSGEA